MPSSGSSWPISILQSVVLPTPLRPMMAIFSPRVTRALKSSATFTPGQCLVRCSTVSVCFPLGRFCSNLMKGRSMLLRLRSASWSFSIAFFRLCTWLARVPAEKRATKSWSWAIFFCFSAFSDSMRERTPALAITMSSYPPG